MNYLIHLLIMIGIYLMLAYSLNLLTGFGGLLSLSHAAFYGIGAYFYVLFSMHFKMEFISSLILSVIFTSLIAYIISLPALKFRGDFFVFFTLGFQMIVFVLLYNWVSLTRGPYGIPGIPRPSILGLKIDSLLEILLLVILLNLIFSGFLFLLYKSPFGLILKSLRENEIAAQSLGISPFKEFSKAFTVSGGIAAVSGSLYASYITYIDPTSFTLDESIFILALLLLGGSGNKKGPFWGTVIMILLPEGLRFLGLPDSIAANMRQIIYGLTLILLMYFRPQGIAGEFEVK